jgi:O-antigen biosynthesis protein
MIWSQLKRYNTISKPYKWSQRHVSSSQNKGDLLILSPTLWAEPNSSAAGVRTSALLKYFANSSSYDKVHFACGAKGEPETKLDCVSYHNLPANRTYKIQNFLKQQNNLDVVIFDRFFAEEAYSFHFHNEANNILRVLDMQDMHSLRSHRQNIVKSWDNKKSGVGLDCLKDGSIIESIPTIHTYNSKQSLLLRELAAIHRCDLVMVCSSKELALLQNEFGVRPEKLVLAPFFVPPKRRRTLNFEQRKDFVFLGGFKHPPNIDQVKILKDVLWKQIRKQLPDANLHIYGAYPPLQVQQMHDKRNGFLVHGFLPNLDDLNTYRVMLAPIRYGAGLKGKIVDSWIHGCPVVSTTMGLEGMFVESDENFAWGGLIGNDNEEFIKNAVTLYSDSMVWKRSQVNGISLLHNLFEERTNLERIQNAISIAKDNKDVRRSQDYTSALLWAQTARSTEYFSKWVELKERQQNVNNAED